MSTRLDKAIAELRDAAGDRVWILAVDTVPRKLHPRVGAGLTTYASEGLPLYVALGLIEAHGARVRQRMGYFVPLQADDSGGAPR